MSTEQGPQRPIPSFPGGTAGGISNGEDASAGCLYHSGSGECGEAGALYQLSGVRVELCPDHLEDVLEENNLEQMDAGDSRHQSN